MPSTETSFTATMRSPGRKSERNAGPSPSRVITSTARVTGNRSARTRRQVERAITRR